MVFFFFFWRLRMAPSRHYVPGPWGALSGDVPPCIPTFAQTSLEVASLFSPNRIVEFCSSFLNLPPTRLLYFFYYIYFSLGFFREEYISVSSTPLSLSGYPAPRRKLCVFFPSFLCLPGCTARRKTVRSPFCPFPSQSLHLPYAILFR